MSFEHISAPLTRAIATAANAYAKGHHMTEGPQRAPDPDYTEMLGHRLVEALGDDAGKWACAFRQVAIKLGYSDMDEGWLIGWFANAIEHSSDVRSRRSKPEVQIVNDKFPS